MFTVGPRTRSSARPRATAPEGAAPSRCTPSVARGLVLSGRAPDALIVSGPLTLAGETRLRELPRDLTCTRLDVSNCDHLTRLPSVLRAEGVIARALPVRELEGDWLVRGHLDLSGNRTLTALPERLTASSLDVSGCSSLRALPSTMHLTGTLELADSGLTDVPSGLRVRLTWHGVPIDEKLAFRPDEVRARDVLFERNLTRRRLMLDRVGLARFFHELGGLVLDRDRDAGGERRLLMATLPDDEPIVVLSVRCPSTGRPYVLRVPPHVRRCRQAAAWLAGFDDERAYDPVQEA